MPHNPNLVPISSAEATNAALAKAIYEVGHIRARAEEGRAVCTGDIADALEAILDLVAPHWRPMKTTEK